MKLTDEEHQAIIGSLLGDGSLRSGTAPTAEFRENHSIKQKEYLEWKFKLLKSLPGAHLRDKYCHHNPEDTKRKYKTEQIALETSRTEILYPYYREFYPEGTKVIPREMVKTLGPLGLAIWHMDDGTFYRGLMVRLATKSFTAEEITFLRTVLKDNFGLESFQTKSRMLCLNRTQSRKMVEIIRPYIVPSMSYKIGEPSEEFIEYLRAKYPEKYQK